MAEQRRIRAVSSDKGSMKLAESRPLLRRRPYLLRR